MTHSLHRSGRAILSILTLACVLFSGIASAATYTLAPLAYQTVLDTNGNPVSGAKICTYLAGTTTPTATFSDSIGTPNANPIVADSSGRFVAYLLPGASYKFIFQDATGTAATCNGVVIRTQDNISAVPAAAVNLDVTGTAGEALTAGQAVYLSDGSGSKAAGQWFKADSANAYSSSVAVSVGMVPTSIVSGAAGTIRLAGQMTGLSSLTLGGAYYVGTAGAITATAPANARKIGEADTTTTLVLPLPAVPTQQWVNDFRLTLTTATPVTTADVTGASAVTVFLSPYVGNRIDLPDASGNPQRVTTAEISIAVPATTATMYDVFAFLNGSTATLELLAWTNDTTRATALVRTNGRLLKTGDLTRLYVGSVRTGAVSGQTEDSLTKRLVWNYYNRVKRPMVRVDSTATWTYTTAGYRQANGAAANQLAAVIGVVEAPMELMLVSNATNSSAAPGVVVANAIGLDGTGAFISSYAVAAGNAYTGGLTALVVTSRVFPSAGYHFYVWMEYSTASGTTTWTGTNGSLPFNVSGIFGTFEG
jgi:hypothetical protein